MKKYLLGLLVVLAFSLRVSATSYQYPFVINLPCLAQMTTKVASVKAIYYPLNGGGICTNTLTSSSYYANPIADSSSVQLVANLKTGYTDAKFAYVIPAWGTTQPATLGTIASGGELPFYSVGSMVLQTSVTNLEVSPVTVTLSFNANGGSVSPSSKTITYDSTYGTLPTPTRTGYTWNGWKGEGKVWKSTDTVKTVTNQTFTAAWVANTYSVKFNANGGTGTMSNQSFTYGVPQKLTSCAFTRANYTFAGWSTTASGSKVYSNQQSVSNLTATNGGTVNLYAVWTANTYTIHYHSNYEKDVDQTVSVTYGNKVTIPSAPASRTGYTFLGWAKTSTSTTAAYTAGSSVDSATLTFTSGVLHLYAVWSAYTYTVKFNANGGTGTMSNQSFAYNVAQTLTPCAFTRANYTCDGWSTTASGAKVYDDQQTVSNLTATANGTVNLYAVWKANGGYTIYHHRNFGTDQYKTVTLTYGDTVTLAAAYSRTGYKSLGWAKSKNATAADFTAGQSVSSTSLTFTSGVLHLYEVWSAYTYTVTFAANGGEGTMDAQARKYDDGVALPDCQFTRRGYAFDQWQVMGETTTYAAGSKANLTTKNGDTVALQALWRTNTYTVVLNANGGVFGRAADGPTVSNLVVTVGEEYGAFPVVTNFQPKLVFNGWWTTTNGVSSSVAATDLVPAFSAGVTNLVAHWTKDDPLAIALDAEGMAFFQSRADQSASSDRWEAVGDTSGAPDGDAACALIESGLDYDAVTMTTQVVGPGTLTFEWKILSNSQPNAAKGESSAYIWNKTAEKLFFDIGTVRMRGIAGSSTLFYRVASFNGLNPVSVDRQTTNPGWVKESIYIEAEANVTNTLAWTFDYSLENPTPGKAWVNAVKWVPGVVEDAELRTLLGLSMGATEIEWTLVVSEIACSETEVTLAVTLARSEDGVVVTNRAVNGTLKLQTASALEGPYEEVSATAENAAFAAGDTAVFTLPREANGTLPVFYKAVLVK